MPFYEYECASCKFYTELMQKLSDPPLKKCPSCGKNTMKKLISAPVFRLKGGGWYETDFKSDKESKRNLAGEGSEGSDAKAKEATAATDSKAADSKSESKPVEKASASTAEKPVKAVSKSASKTTARKPPPKTKAKAKAKVSKRRGR
jgi:putative FmdB family regulatory protein